MGLGEGLLVGRFLMENGKLFKHQPLQQDRSQPFVSFANVTDAGEVSARKGLKRRLGILAQQYLTS